MKRVLALATVAAAVVVWSCSAATGGVSVTSGNLNLARDTATNANTGEEYNGAGASGEVRGAKGPGAETYICDLPVGTGTEPGTILQWMADNPLLNAAETYGFFLHFMPVDQWPDQSGQPGGNEGNPDAQLYTLNLLHDWVEDDQARNPGGSAADNFGWTDPTVNPGTTNMYAQTYEDPASPGNPDTARSVAWVAEDGNPASHGAYYRGDNLWKILNSNDVYVAPDDYFSHVTVQLDYDKDDDPDSPSVLMNDVLYNEYNRGIAFYGPTWDNTYMYAKDRDNVGQRPYLTISIFSHDGDVNRDGRVDYIDLGILATNYDQPGMTWGEGDFNGDGNVDYIDLGILATNYDYGTGGGAPVPEPAAALLLVAGAALMRRRRR